MRRTSFGSWAGVGLVLAVLAGCSTPVVSPAPLTGPVRSAATNAAAGWQAYPDAPSARYRAGAVPIGLMLYVVGGQEASGAPLATAEQFKAFDSWQAVPPMPTPR